MPVSSITRTIFGIDAINYARGGRRGHNGQERRNLYVGCVNMLPDKAVPIEKQMQPIWDRMNAHHIVQIDRCMVSFHPDELDPDDPEDQLVALEIGYRIAKANAPDSQSAIFVQNDGKGHKLHLHIVTNDVQLDGKGVPKKTYYHPHFRGIVDRICRDYFELVNPTPAPERVTQAERGRRLRNEAIREWNDAEKRTAKDTGRPPRFVPEYYVWKDDLKERIKAAAKLATDEESFAHLLRLDGVELLTRPKEDGGVTYARHATKKMPEHYVYELVDTSGFGWGEKIPSRMRCRSCTMGTEYNPDHIRSMFREKQQAAGVPDVTIDVRGIIAEARGEEPGDIDLHTMTPEENDQVERARSLAMAKEYVSRILEDELGDEGQDLGDVLFDRFIAWRDEKRMEAAKDNRPFEPIIKKDWDGYGTIIPENLEMQYRAFLHQARRDMGYEDLWREAERKNLAKREKAKERDRFESARAQAMSDAKEKVELDRAHGKAKAYVSKILRSEMPDVDSDTEGMLFVRFIAWRRENRKHPRPPVIRKDEDGRGTIVPEALDAQYLEFLDKLGRHLVDVGLSAEEKAEKERKRIDAVVKRYVSKILKEEMPDADEVLEDELFNRFMTWRIGRRSEEAANGRKLPPVVTKTRYGRGVIVPEQLDLQYRAFLEKIRQNEEAQKLREMQKLREDLVADIRQTAKEAVKQDGGPVFVAGDGHGNGAVEDPAWTRQENMVMVHAVELAKRFVSAIVKTVYPDADREWEDQLYDRFVEWRDVLRKKWQEKGQVLPPIYRKTVDGEGQIEERALKQQYSAFLGAWKDTDAAKELARTQRERMSLARAMELAKRFVSAIVRTVYPNADEEWEDQLYDRFVEWRDVLRKKWQAKGQVFPPIYRKTADGESRIEERNLEEQYRTFLGEWKVTEAAEELERIQRERMALAADIIRTAEEIERKKQEEQAWDREHGDG